MKKKEKEELHTKEIQELTALLKEARQALASLVFEAAQHKLKNTRSVFLKRKEIAVIETILKAKEFMYGRSTKLRP